MRIGNYIIDVVLKTKFNNRNPIQYVHTGSVLVSHPRITLEHSTRRDDYDTDELGYYDVRAALEKSLSGLRMARFFCFFI